MLIVSIHHSSQDREIALLIASRLETGAEAKVWLEECGPERGRSIASAWETVDSSGATLLLLSPNSVPTRLDRKHWQPLLTLVEKNVPAGLGTVLLEECPYPRLLDRTHFFRWTDGTRELLRAIERWVLSLHPASDRQPFVPAKLPWFEGRQGELEALWDGLVDRPGTVVLANAATGSGKSSLAQQFVHTAAGHFRDVFWIPCGERSQSSYISELGAELGVSLDGSTEEALDRIGPVLRDHRLLVVLDDLREEAPVETLPEGRCSLLITGRSGDFSMFPSARVMPVEPTTPPELEEFPSDSSETRLLRAISVCQPERFPIELAAEMIGLGADEAAKACMHLVAGRWIDPFDLQTGRFRIGAGKSVLRLPDAEREDLRQRHADALRRIFSHWRDDMSRCTAYLPEFELAFGWALESDWPRANGLADRAFPFLCDQHRLPEAIQIAERMIGAAESRHEARVAERWRSELSWFKVIPGVIRWLPPESQLSLFGWES